MAIQKIAGNIEEQRPLVFNNEFVTNSHNLTEINITWKDSLKQVK